MNRQTERLYQDIKEMEKMEYKENDQLLLLFNEIFLSLHIKQKLLNGLLKHGDNGLNNESFRILINTTYLLLQYLSYTISYIKESSIENLLYQSEE